MVFAKAQKQRDATGNVTADIQFAEKRNIQHETVCQRKAFPGPRGGPESATGKSKTHRGFLDLHLPNKRIPIRYFGVDENETE